MKSVDVGVPWADDIVKREEKEGKIENSSSLI